MKKLKASIIPFFDGTHNHIRRYKFSDVTFPKNGTVKKGENHYETDISNVRELSLRVKILFKQFLLSLLAYWKLWF